MAKKATTRLELRTFAVAACWESSCAAASPVSQAERQERAQSSRGGHRPEESPDAGTVDCELHGEWRDGGARAPGKIQEGEHGGSPLGIAVAGEHAVGRHGQAQPGAEEQEEKKQSVAAAESEASHADGDHRHAGGEIAMKGRSHQHGTDGGAGEDRQQ